MENVNCIVCNGESTKILFDKESKTGEVFTLAECNSCGLQFLSPRPALEEMEKYYSLEYFTNRTERGYNNYFSSEIRNEIERVIKLNLNDLGFYKFEKNLPHKKRSLDIGCAAGYFVAYMKDRNWDSVGVDVSADCVDFAIKAGIDVKKGDYLEISFQEKFDLITLWASIEHLHHPEKFLKKVNDELNENGMLYISTCRVGGLNFMKLFKKRWRYYNFPEHLYFFSRSTMKKLLKSNGFKMVKYNTYGSGFGNPGSLTRKIADYMAKRLYLGDMMLIAVTK